MSIFSTIPPSLICAVFAVLIFFVELVVWLKTIGKISFFKNSLDQNQNFPPVSIIICARNEGDNLTEFLPKILLQNYPSEFEVIVVNDCSWDNTGDVLREYGKEFENLREIKIKEDEYYKHGKKFALMVGIKGAKYEHLLLTDADCYPNSEFWIKGIMSSFKSDTEIVLGYGAYKKEAGFINKLIRYDTFKIGAHFLSSALRKKAYMGIGRNLSYKKEIFFKNKGFSTHYHIPSGDDDLFINQAATSSNVAVNFDSNTFTYSLPKKSFSEWVKQKSRHLQTSPLYKKESKNRLVLEHALPYLFWLLIIACFFLGLNLIFPLILMLTRFIVQFSIYYKAFKKLDEFDLIFYFIIFDFILLICYPYFHLHRKLSKNNKWKN